MPAQRCVTCSLAISGKPFGDPGLHPGLQVRRGFVAVADLFVDEAVTIPADQEAAVGELAKVLEAVLGAGRHRDQAWFGAWLGGVHLGAGREDLVAEVRMQRARIGVGRQDRLLALDSDAPRAQRDRLRALFDGAHLGVLEHQCTGSRHQARYQQVGLQTEVSGLEDATDEAAVKGIVLAVFDVAAVCLEGEG